MPRILSIWLPQLPLDRLIRKEDERLSGAFGIVAEDRNAWRITHVNQRAIDAGVQVGQPLADARAICPDLLTEQTDTLNEALLLQALWRWADCLSPRVSLDAPDGLLLDVSGCAHLFGGEMGMGKEALSRLQDLSITAQIGIADTKGAARAMARFGESAVSIAPPGKTHATLAPLPIAALGLPEQMALELARAGLSRIGQLYDQSSAELARRFSLSLTQSLSAATGTHPDPISPQTASPIYAARMTLPEPIGYVEDLERVLERLANRVCQRLEHDQRGARQFHLTVRGVDSTDHHFTIGFATPCHDPKSILRQFGHPLSQLEIDYGADWFRLRADHIEPIRLRQMAMGEETKKEDDRRRLIETLGNRIGFDHVRVFSPGNSHLPEHEFEQVEAIHGSPEWVKSPRERPIRLFSPAEQIQVDKPGRPPRVFRWRQLVFETYSIQGPERLSPRWHCDQDLRTRDYWKVQTKGGRRLWLLTYPGEIAQNWYVAGEFP